MDAQTFVRVALIALLVLLAVRIAIPTLSRFRRVRRPEGRVVRVIGVGGGGSNAVDHMLRAGVRGVDFIACNTDAQALRRSLAATKIRFGDAITHGLGSGGDPDVGRRAAEDDAQRIARAVVGSDLVFVTAGLGGGTGSGSGPIVASKAKEQGALTIAVVTKPFEFEGPGRRRIADEAAALLTSSVDALIVIPNDAVAQVLSEDATMLDAFAAVDDVLRLAVQGIVDLIVVPGLVNLDFADIRAVLRDAGPALMGLGHAGGDDRAIAAARQAISSPLLEASIEGARAILFHISGPSDLRLREVMSAAAAIRETADPDTNVSFGATFDPTLGDEVRITLIATGLAVRQATAPTAAPGVPEIQTPRATGRRRGGAVAAAEATISRPPPGGDGVDQAVTEVPSAVALAELPPAFDASATDEGQMQASDLDVPSFIRRRRPEAPRDHR